MLHHHASPTHCQAATLPKKPAYYILWLVALAIPWIVVAFAVKPYWHANDLVGVVPLEAQDHVVNYWPYQA
jgi:hypothetical protein